ncbi:MAG: hypothetical protein ACKO38_04465 [Planctomycetota bacterium]
MLDFFTEFAKLSSLGDTRGVDNHLSKFGRHVALALIDADRSDRSDWHSAARGLLERIAQGQCLSSRVCDIEWTETPDADAHKRRFQAQFTGIIETIRSLVDSPLEVNAEAAKRAAESFLRAWVAQDWKPNWQAPRIQRGSEDNLTYKLDRYPSLRGAFPKEWHAGHWTVYNLLGQWQCFGQDWNGKTRQTLTPIALWLPSNRIGLVPMLCVELTLGESGPFLPCADRLGLTLALHVPGGADGRTLANKPEADDFLASMQRAWVAAGMAERPVRGRWWLESRSIHDPELPTHEPPTPVIGGRSAEVAAYCAVRAAYDGLSLDHMRLVTGTIESNGTSDGDRELTVGPVAHVSEKASAVRASGRTDPLLASLGTAQQLPEERKKGVSDTHLATEAYEALQATRRIRDAYVKRVRDAWRTQWIADSVESPSTRGVDENQQAAAPSVNRAPPASPFIDTQGFHLLMELFNPKEWLQTKWLRWHRSQSGSEAALSSYGDWRDQAVEDALRPWRVKDTADPSELDRYLFRPVFCLLLPPGCCVWLGRIHPRTAGFHV